MRLKFQFIKTFFLFGILTSLLLVTCLLSKVNGQQVIVNYLIEEKPSSDVINDGRMIDFPEKSLMATLKATTKASIYSQDSLMFTREGVLAQGFRLYYPGAWEFRDKLAKTKLTHKLYFGRNEYFESNLDENIDNDCDNWKIDANKTKNVLGIECTMASRTCDGLEIFAYFTRSIAIVDGPVFYSSLPGLVLELDDGKYHYLAKHITAIEDEILPPQIIERIDPSRYSPSETKLVISKKNVSVDVWINLLELYQIN